MCDPGTTVACVEASRLSSLWIFSDADTHGDREADARLIATAPELLAERDALKARSEEMEEALAEAQASYLRLAQSVRNCGHEHLLSDEDDAALSHTKEQR